MFLCIYFVQMCWFDVFSPTLLQSVQCASANKKQREQICKCYQMISWSVLCYASRFYDRLAARRIFCRHCKQDHRRWRKSNPELLAYFSFWQICFATFKLQPLLFLLISPSVMQIIWELLLRLIYLSSFLSPLLRGVFFLHFTVATNKDISRDPIFCQ